MLQARFDKCLCGLLPGKGEAVLLAVSGGIDSMVMADLFLRSALTPRLLIAHCNFHLRGDESDGDASFVREWAEGQGIPFFEADFDTSGHASSHGLSIEMAARELRYSWFASLCEEQGCRYLATAHNANDNAETLFLNLLRGTGLKGICGMKESSCLAGTSDALLIRPLLGFTREEIREYAAAHSIGWREDSTNSDSAYKRNLLRNEVFPLLMRVNPSFLGTLQGDMHRFAQAQEIVDDFVAVNALAACSFSGDTLTIDKERLLSIPHWEYLLYRILEPYGFNQPVVEDLTGLLRNGSTFSGRRFLSGSHVATTSSHSIEVTALPMDPASGSEAGNEVIIEGPGEYSVKGVRFLVEEFVAGSLRQPEGTIVANLDFPIRIRTWLPGDWIRPLGMEGRRKKLSDMFVDLKFSSREKEEALVISGEGSHVVALVGYRIDESVAVSQGDRCVRVRLI